MENTQNNLKALLSDAKLLPALRRIAEKVLHNQRITSEEGLLLFEDAPLSFVGALANYVRQRKNGDSVFFNKNFHIEPTNVCIYTCDFCSYSRRIKKTRGRVGIYAR
jgi:aminodeoxyfutalosine synthase